MKDLTQGPISRLLVAMAAPIAIGMLFQTLYFLVDLYFVSRLGDVAIAGVSSAGTVSFVILALTQMLGVGTVALVSQAAGRKDRAEANLIFNQSVLLSAICGLLTLVWGFLAGGAYVRWVAADAEHLGECQDHEAHGARGAHPRDRRTPEARDEVQVDEEIQRLENHADGDRHRHCHEQPGDRPLSEVFHGVRLSLCP